MALTHDLPKYYDIISSINKSEAWYMSTVSSYVTESSFNHNFCITYINIMYFFHEFKISIIFSHHPSISQDTISSFLLLNAPG